MKKIFALFLDMLYISAFTFGGGFVIVSIMKKKFVDEKKLITDEEMMDFTAIAQSSPGAIAVNAAILVGRKVAGFPGMAVAVLGTIIPPIVIISIISFFYAAFASNTYVALMLKGMSAGVSAVVLDVALSLFTDEIKGKKILGMILGICAFAATFFFGINVVYIILFSAIAGILVSAFSKRRAE
ncbi:MAG: chromate transporter [Lachnospiraceae bacterium]|nr:chromate transporter [Lachnospiraceae bacterium]